MVLRRSSRSALAKPPSESAAAKPKSRKNGTKRRKLSQIHEVPPAPKQLKPYFNPLPVPPQKKRPGLQPFFWGTGNFGQFGMGPESLAKFQSQKGTHGSKNTLKLVLLVKMTPGLNR